jgi:hypothetical protein
MNGYRKCGVHIHNGVLFGHKEENYGICRKLDGTGDHHVK